MTDFIFLTCNDIHISDNNPRSRIDNFKESILDKLSQIGSACNKLNADGCIIAGDLFNLKNPARNSHELVQDLMRVFKKFNCPIYMIEGNHDLTADDLNTVGKQPLGDLFESGLVIKLREEIIEKNGKKISLVGVPYTDKVSLLDIELPSKEGCIAQICALHMYASPTKGMLFEDRIFGYDEILGLGSDIHVIGHYHIDQGAIEFEGKHFINIGSLSRGTLTNENIDHEPQMGFIKISEEATTVQTIKLKVKPASEIFDLERREEEKRESEEIELFVQKLVTDSVEASDINADINIEEILSGMDMAKEVRERTLHFIREAAALK